MARWLTFIKERLPLPTYILLVGGFVLSSYKLAAIYGLETNNTTLVTFMTFLGLMIFFAELRFMDELKDFEKDKVAHPQRPLPRGLISQKELNRIVQYGIFAMLANSVLMAIFINTISGLLYAFVTLYLWLMYKEFFLGPWLQERPILYACTHQIIIVPLTMITTAAYSPSQVFSSGSIALGVLILGAFFSYEVCRKLNPNAHPVLKTYLSVYGPLKTFILVVCLTFLSSMASSVLTTFSLTLPIQLFFTLSFFLMFSKPEKYKVVEGMATLNLLIHLYAFPLIYYWGNK